jgi:hypothetical protein
MGREGQKAGRYDSGIKGIAIQDATLSRHQFTLVACVT